MERATALARPTALAAGGAIALLGAVGGGVPGLLYSADGRSGPGWTALSFAVGAASVLSGFSPRHRMLAWISACCWVLLAIATVAPGSLTGFVGPAECLFLATAAMSGAASRKLGLPLAGAAAVMLVLFGTIHLVHSDAIASLVPPFVPYPDRVPFATGALMVAAGMAMPWRRARRPFVLAVALMFAAWVPLVHGARLAASPTDTFEWQFALMAVALAAGLVFVAGPYEQARLRD